MRHERWHSPDGRRALIIASDGIIALLVIPIVNLTPINFGLKLLSFFVLMTIPVVLVKMAVDHYFSKYTSDPSNQPDKETSPPTIPLPVGSIPPPPGRQPSVGSPEATSLMEYREKRHKKRFVKEAWSAFLGAWCLLLGLVTVLILQAIDSQGIATLVETNWVLAVALDLTWIFSGWLAFENKVRKHLTPTDGIHPPHRFGRILSGGSFLLSVVWVAWVNLSINNAGIVHNEAASMLIVIGVVGSILVAANCFTLYREWWWHQHHWLIVSGITVRITYPKNKWLRFTGGVPEINVWQVLNRIDQGQTQAEMWWFKDSSNVLINGPGEDDKLYFANMSDVLHFARLKEVIDNNSEVYYNRHHPPELLG
jgi:hypothetical protein